MKFRIPAWLFALVPLAILGWAIVSRSSSKSEIEKKQLRQDGLASVEALRHELDQLPNSNAKQMAWSGLELAKTLLKSSVDMEEYKIDIAQFLVRTKKWADQEVGKIQPNNTQDNKGAKS